MSEQFQTFAALVVVAVTALLLARPLLAKRRKPGCGGGCGCPTDQFKAKLKR